MPTLNTISKFFSKRSFNWWKLIGWQKALSLDYFFSATGGYVLNVTKYYRILKGLIYVETITSETAAILKKITGFNFQNLFTVKKTKQNRFYKSGTLHYLNKKEIEKKKFFFIFLVRAWKGFEFFDRCIDSIFAQKQKNYTIIYIDDNSQLSPEQKRHISQLLQKHTVIFNLIKKFSLRNAYETLHQYVPPISATNCTQIVISLDGDDWLLGKNVLATLESVYRKTNPVCTYGNCKIFKPGSNDDGKLATQIDSFSNRRFPRAVEQKKSFRLHFLFSPLHLKTWRLDAFLLIPKSYFLRPNGDWIKFCEDQAIMYSLLEMAEGKYVVINRPLSVYNRSHAYHDDRLNLKEMLFDEVIIRKKNSLTNKL